MWATLDFYHNEYLLGDSPLIPNAAFPRWEQSARVTINRRRIELEEIPDYLKQCTCEVAEALFTQSQAPKAGELKSESNAGYSWTATPGQETREFNSNIRGIIIKHLAGTELHNYFVCSGV